MTTTDAPERGATCLQALMGAGEIVIVVQRSPARFTARTHCGDPACAHEPCRELTCGNARCQRDACVHAPVLFDGPMTLTNSFPIPVPVAGAFWIRLGDMLLASAADPVIKAWRELRNTLKEPATKSPIPPRGAT